MGAPLQRLAKPTAVPPKLPACPRCGVLFFLGTRGWDVARFNFEPDKEATQMERLKVNFLFNGPASQTLILRMSNKQRIIKPKFAARASTKGK